MSSKCGGERRGGRAKAKSVDTTVLFPPIHVRHATGPGSGPRAPPRNKMALYEHVTTPSTRNIHFLTAPGGAIENGGMSSQLLSVKEHVAVSSSAYERRFEYPSFHAVAAANRASWAHQWSERSNATCPNDKPISTTTTHLRPSQSGSRSGAGGTKNGVSEGSAVSLVTGQGRSMGEAQPQRAERPQKSVPVTQVSMDSCTVTEAPPVVERQVPQQAPPSVAESSGPDSCRRPESSATAGWNTPGITPKRFFLERHIEDSRQSEDVGAKRQGATGGETRGGGSNEEGVEDCPEECPSSPRTSSGGGLSEQSPPIESRDEAALAVEAVGPMTVVARIGQQDFWKARKTVLRQQRILSAQVFELHRMLQVQQELLPQAPMPPPSWHYPLSGPHPPRPKETPSWPSIHSTQVDPTAATAATAATAQFAYPAYSTATQSTCAQNPPHARLEKVVAIAMVRQEGGERRESAGWMGVHRLAEEGDRVGRWSFEAPYERRCSHPQTSEASTASERPLGGAWGGGGDSSTGMRSGAGREWAHGWGSTPGREWEGGRLGGDVGEKRVGGGGRRELELFPLVPAGDEGGVDFRLSPRMGTKIVPRALVGTPKSTAGILASIQRQ